MTVNEKKNASVEDEEAELDLGTCFGAVPPAGRLTALAAADWRSSESEPLSQASSQSALDVEVKCEECTAMCGLAGGDIGFIVTAPCTCTVHLGTLHLDHNSWEFYL